MQSALRGEHDADVPCGDCTACCTASQFVHIEPDETDALTHIPEALLFPAPRRPRGHLLMGYDERGHCPMLVDGACSIYDHRPRTCRTYDCRVFPATGLAPDDDQKVMIAERAARWRFDFSGDDDRRTSEAVRAAVTFLQLQPENRPPRSTTALAVRAVEIHEDFLD